MRKVFALLSLAVGMLLVSDAALACACGCAAKKDALKICAKCGEFKGADKCCKAEGRSAGGLREAR